MWIDWHGENDGPKRGDLFQSSVGTKRERTWMVLRVRPIRRRDPNANRRFEVFMARWWELDAEMRMRLYRSAERNGGQKVHEFWWYPRTKRKTREQEFFERG